MAYKHKKKVNPNRRGTHGKNYKVYQRSAEVMLLTNKTLITHTNITLSKDSLVFIFFYWLGS